MYCIPYIQRFVLKVARVLRWLDTVMLTNKDGMQLNVIYTNLVTYHVNNKYTRKTSNIACHVRC